MTINSISTYWHNCNRVVFMTDDFHGIIEVQYPKDEEGLAYIWHLWVDLGYRGRGYATKLLDAAEEHARLQLCDRAVLEWDRRDTPVEILEWYHRRGYRETGFNRHISYNEKNLTLPE